MITSTNVNIKILRDGAKLPTYGSEHAAGADLYACIEVPITIGPQDTVLVPTGLAMELPEGCAGLIYARSGLATRKGLAPANKVGVIDSDYRGEVLVALHNHTMSPRTIDPGERIAQMVITPYIIGNFNAVEELDDTDRGEGGFGSTGTL